MNSLLQSSLYGHEFVKYRDNNSKNERIKFSNQVKMDEIPIVIDSIDSDLSELLSGKNAKRYKRNGHEYYYHIDITIEDILLELKSKIMLTYKDKTLKLGLENGKILDSKELVGNLYKKYKNKDDNILYLLLTQEETLYGYIISLLRYIFGENFMKVN